MTQLSKTQIDRLGDHLRKSPLSDLDLKTLDDYRRSFVGAYDEVVRMIRERIYQEVAGRPAKSTSSIIEKLHRETIRLTQIQDIAGCRVVVDSIQEQERIVSLLLKAIPLVSVMDRRKFPSYGYRAVHLIVQILGKVIEVQIRTRLQHGWAELSEKYSDKINPAIKYGGGPEEIREELSSFSALVREYEELEEGLSNIRNKSQMSEAEKNLCSEVDNLKRRITEQLKRLSK